VHLKIKSTAAAMSYGLLVAGTKTWLIMDIDGGTTDLTVLSIADGDVYNIKGTAGTRQGGELQYGCKVV
jgi:heat shock protein 1/8